MYDKPVIAGFRDFTYFGEGSCFVAWYAVQDSLQRHVLLQVLKPSVSESPYYREYFFRIAKAVARIKSDYLPQVLDIVNTPENAYVILEPVSGRLLGTVLQEQGTLPWAQATRIASGIASALQALSSKAKIVHRNIKPGVILLSNDNLPQIWDLSMSVIVDHGFSISTHTQGHIEGLPGYLSPELIGLAPVLDTRSDMYSLGVLLFAMITGQEPFEADTPEAVIHRQLSETLPSVSDLVSGVPVELNEAIARLTATDPSARFADWAAVQATLQKTLSCEPAPEPKSKVRLKPKRNLAAQKASHRRIEAAHTKDNHGAPHVAVRAILWLLLFAGLAALGSYRWKNVNAVVQTISYDEHKELMSLDDIGLKNASVRKTELSPEIVRQMVAAIKSTDAFAKLKSVIQENRVEFVDFPEILKASRNFPDYNRLFERGLGKKVGEEVALEYKGASRTVVLKEIAPGKITMDRNGRIGSVESSTENITDAERLKWADRPMSLGEAFSYMILCVRGGQLSRAEGLGLEFPEIESVVKALGE